MQQTTEDQSLPSRSQLRGTRGISLSLPESRETAKSEPIGPCVTYQITTNAGSASEGVSPAWHVANITIVVQLVQRGIGFEVSGKSYFQARARK